MKFEIILHTTIEKPIVSAWQVINDLDRYPEWNPFVIRCESTLEPDSPIFMWVKLLPFTLKQKETVRHNDGQGFIEYGIHVPGLLFSSRQHKLVACDNNNACFYHSIFRLEGILAPLVGKLLGKRLFKGFRGMTEALKIRTEAL